MEDEVTKISNLIIATGDDSLLDYFQEMVKEREFLECLRAAGVDNWQGYSDAQQMMEDEE